MQETVVPAPTGGGATVGSEERQLIRSIDWTGAFWIASGIPAAFLFSIGGIAGTTGKLAFLVWMISITMGFFQSFTYAEIAGMFANKSGGASVYGATAWIRYSKLVAPLSVWCNWFAWSPVLSLGCAIAAAYLLNAFAPIPSVDSSVVKEWVSAHAGTAIDAQRITEWLAANAGKTAIDAQQALLQSDAVAALTPAIRTWELASFDILGLASAHLNATFFIGAALMLIIFAIQHRGVAATAGVQKLIGMVVIGTIAVVGVTPILMGKIDWSNFANLVPPAAPYSAEPGAWSNGGWTLFLGGLFIAAWSTYAFENAVCYTSELKDPKRDTFKAIFYSGLLCLVMFSLVPFTFQGVLGVQGMLDPSILDGSGVGAALAGMVGGGPVVLSLLVGLMILAVVLNIMTAMAGSSRTLYQGSVDGWLPKYLSHVNENGAPTRAMWTDLVFNLGLLALASDPAGYFFVLAVANVGYIIFNFLNLNAGWIHRIDSPHVERPWRAPTFLIGFNTLLAFVNCVLLGAGAKVWGYSNALWVGFGFAALIIPVFIFRHYVQDKGQLPACALIDLGVAQGSLGERRAGILPYVALIAGVAVVLVSNEFFQLP
nr:APC family permease [Hyphomicrobium sp. 99]